MTFSKNRFHLLYLATIFILALSWASVEAACGSGCQACNGNTCTTCKSGYVLSSGQCIATCQVTQCPVLSAPSTGGCVALNPVCTTKCDSTRNRCDKKSDLAYCAYAFMPSTVTCRPAAGDCDVAERCTGTNATCPTNIFKPTTTVCRQPAGTIIHTYGTHCRQRRCCC